MEYTKDIIFGVRYDEVHNTLKTVKPKRTSRFLQLVKRHKFVIVTVLSAMAFICIDAVLITNFFRILTTL